MPVGLRQCTREKSSIYTALCRAYMFSCILHFKNNQEKAGEGVSCTHKYKFLWLRDMSNLQNYHEEF